MSIKNGPICPIKWYLLRIHFLCNSISTLYVLIFACCVFVHSFIFFISLFSPLWVYFCKQHTRENLGILISGFNPFLVLPCFMLSTLMLFAIPFLTCPLSQRNTFSLLLFSEMVLKFDILNIILTEQCFPKCLAEHGLCEMLCGKKTSEVKHHEEGGILCTTLESLNAQQHRQGSDKSCSGG